MNKHASHLVVAGLLSLPFAVMAHTGHHGQGFADGFAHPFLGIDHLAAMLMVGIWSVLNTRRVWIAPLTFILLLTLGALAGQQGFSIPQLEPLVAASVIILGVMLMLPFKPGATTSLAVIGAFAFCHGLAHGSELTAGSSILSGMILGSALLHGIGMLIAQRVLRHRTGWTLRLGQAVALLGSGLLFSALI
ncbi:HupE/UreJ family protein [Azonexus sp.]|uniref:HupE/UreJ family protein n=1 Tax=Azonexus sp. TaxID=1872668 RepID=UPI0027BA52EF|nr:HupE/UreJ family protein [Azonexus sp.]